MEITTMKMMKIEKIRGKMNLIMIMTLNNLRYQIIIVT